MRYAMQRYGTELHAKMCQRKTFFPLFGIMLTLLLIAGSIRISAQSTTGSLAGTITDPAGKVVPGAHITAVEVNSGFQYTGASSATGYYVFPDLHPGEYTLTVEVPGFKKAVRSQVIISIARRSAEDIELAVGSTAQTVNVQSGALTIETQSSDVATSIQPQQVDELPLAVTGSIRALSTLSFLVPGAVGPGTSPGGAGGQIVAKINGGQTLGSDYLVDGISTLREENGSGGFDIYAPSVEAISEFRVEVTALPAEYGRTTGGISNFSSRSGTDQYHGVAYDFYKNAALDANNWFNNGYLANTTNPVVRNSLQRPPDTKNDYGITLGGPVRIPHVYDGRDKSFFFFNWEQLLYSSGSSIASLVPTPAVRGDNGQYADFSSFLGGPTGQINNCTGQPILAGQIFDPETVQNEYTSSECRSPFPNNQIPYSRFSTVARNVLKLLPEPNLTGAGVNNFIYNSTDTISQSVYSIRGDQNIGQNNKVWGFFSSRENSDQGGGINLPPPVNSCCAAINQLGKLLRLGWDWTINPRLVNQITFGANRSNNYTVSIASEMNSDWDKTLGIPNGSGPTFPGFELANSPYPSLGENSYAQDVNNLLQLNEVLNWQHGSHSIRFGGTGEYTQYSFISKIGGTCSGVSGCFTFIPGGTAGTLATQLTSGNSFASFLIGQTTNVNRIVDLHSPRWITNYGDLFIEDDWQARPNLTFNLGLNWSVDTPRREAEGDTSIMDPHVPNPGASGQLGALVFAGVGPGRNGNKNETWANVWYKDYAPRVGFAWTPDSLDRKVVLRGYGGVFYGPLVYADYGQGTNQGFTINTTLFNAGDILSGPQMDAGLPAIPTQPNLNPTQLNGQGVDYVAKSYGRPAMVETWSLEDQMQLTPDMVFTLGYLGQHSTHLHALLEYPNDMHPQYLSLGNTLYDNASTTQAASAGVNVPYANFQQTWGGGGTVQQALRPFPQYGYVNTDSYLQNTGQSSYDAMEVKLERRFEKGLDVLAAYTFSKTITDADSIQPFYSTLQSQGGTQNPFDLKAEKAVSNQDVPNNFVISYLYELPVGAGKPFLAHTPKPISAVISHWRVSGVQRYLSGQPISFFGETGIPGFDNGIRPNRVIGQPVRGSTGHYNPFDFNATNRCGTGYWNCAAFADPNANRGTGTFLFGDMPRNSPDIRSFAYADEDLGLNKTIPIRGSIYVDFRGEAFNAFNRHIFNKPDSGVNDGNFGQINSLLLGPRNIQFVLMVHY